MNGTRHAEAPQPTETRAPALTVPQLSEATIRDRAATAFDAAVQYLMTHDFRRSPPREELQRLQALVDDEVSRVRVPPDNATERDLQRYTDALYAAIDRAMLSFSTDPENAGSLLKLYYDITRSATWITLQGGRVGIDRELLTEGITEAFSSIREEFIGRLALFANQENSDASVDLSYIADFRPELARALSDQLSQQIGSSVPVTMSYNQSAKSLDIVALNRTPVRDVGDATVDDERASGAQQ